MSLDKEKNRLMDLFEEVLSSSGEKAGESEEESLPYQMLDLPNQEDLYVLDPTRKKMIRAKHMTEVVQISLPDKNNKVLVKSSSGDFLFIPLEYVRDIGFN
tara:strand:- start:416 stop:718 length:303 start_codon:yes stop_codon:yes gene_type:complete